MKWSVAFVLAVLPGLAYSITSLGPQTEYKIRLVGTVPLFQRAIKEGVKHIVVTEHLSALSAQQEIEGGGESLDSAIGNVLRDTKSIVGNCVKSYTESPAVAQLRLVEDVPENACVIEVEEDFIQMPFLKGRGSKELWLHNIYIVTHRPNTQPLNKSATTILHKDGSLYITNSVFQGRDFFNRAIDVTTADGGKPVLYVGDSKFVDFRRDHAAAIRGNPNTTVMVEATTFKRCTITELQRPNEDPPKWGRVFGAAVGLFQRSLLALKDVTTEDMVVLGEPAGAKVFSFESDPQEGGNGGEIFATPPIIVWDYSLSISVQSSPPARAPAMFISNGSILEGIRDEQRREMEKALAAQSAEEEGGDSDSSEERSAAADSVATPEDGSGGSGVPVAAYVAIGLAVVILAAVISIWAHRRKRRQHQEAAEKVRAHDAQLLSQAPPPLYPSPTPSAYTSSSQGRPYASGSEKGSQGVPYAHPHGPSLAAVQPMWGPPGYPVGSSQSMTGGESQAGGLYINSVGSPLGPANGGSWAPQSAAVVSSVASQGPAWEKFFSPFTGESGQDGPTPLPPGQTPGRRQTRDQTANSFTTLTFDTTYVTPSLPRPEQPGAILNREQLHVSLDNAADRGEVFLGRFELLGQLQRREGGQGLVQFARVKNTGDGVAIKFFLNRNAFDCEEDLYKKEAFRGLMPAITLIENNDAGVAVTQEGWRYPPFIVVERGESLDEWQLRIQPDFPTVVQMLIHVTERVRTLHEQGIVHRDLKPGNILWRPVQHSWTLIDFGCAAEIGKPARLTFSPGYAPPETLQSVANGKASIHADAASDVWAIGVIAFELLTQRRAFHYMAWKEEDVVRAAMGERAYEWESEVGTFRRVPELRVLSRVVCACLDRDPRKRPHSMGVLRMLNSLYDSHTSTAGDK